MDIQIVKSEFIKAINLVSRFVSARAQIPILGNVYLGTDKSRLGIRATNLEMSVSTHIGAKVKKQGEIAIPARIVNELIGNFSGETLNLLVKGESAVLESEGGRATISGVNVIDFPSFPTEILAKGVLIAFDEFSKVMGKTLFSVSNDDSRPVLTGIETNFGDSEINFCASDGFRLSRNKISVSAIDKKLVGKSLIIPRGLIGELIRMKEKGNLIVNYDNEDNLLLFGLEGTIFSTRLIEGNYPDVGAIIPKSSDTRLKVDGEELLKNIRAAAVFARDAANVLTMSVGENVLEVSSVSPQYGEQKSVLEVNVEGRAQTVLFNYKYLEDILNVIESGQVIIELVNDTSPVVFRDATDDNFLHLIMPVKS